MNKIDFTKIVTIACIPLSHHPHRPSPNHISIEKCPLCRSKMWVGRKCIKFIYENPTKRIAYCIPCLFTEAKKQGIEVDEIEMIHVGNRN